MRLCLSSVSVNAIACAILPASRALQESGRASTQREQLEWGEAGGDSPAGALYDQSLGFTLRWGDTGPVANTDPSPDALRLRVHLEVNADFYTCSFYLDAGKPWGRPALYHPSDAGFAGNRRRRIFEAIDRARAIAEARLRSDAIDADLLPEAGVTASEARDLLGAADFLYEELWAEFERDFQIGRTAIATQSGEIFADFRGLVVATADDAPSPGAAAAKGYEPYAKYKNASGDELNETNAVLKAWWPFLRRLTPNADYREFVASTVMNRRAIYVTPLGAPDEFDSRDKAASLAEEIPALAIPAAADTRTPIRYMFLSKGEPNRRQIGRIVERINNLGTLRLFALKDIAVVREASSIIRMRGQHLDEVTNAWSSARQVILRQSETALAKRGRRKRRLERARNEGLTRLTDDVEGHLIDINAHLDSMGRGAAGALPYVIARSQKHTRQFQELVGLLQPETIETWVSYDQFVQRGLMPTFEFVAGVGQRLKALRDRLQATMEAVQTSAVSIQTAATRHNTDILSDLAVGNKFTGAAVTALTLLLAALNLDKLPSWLLDFLGMH